jgi:hypothetical protein
MVPAMTWFPVTSTQVVAPVVLHTLPATAFGGTNGCVPPQVPPPLPGGTAGYWAVQPAFTGVVWLGFNLSDGGHIENMAVYELLRRRCKFIISIDGEADPQSTFEGHLHDVWEGFRTVCAENAKGRRDKSAVLSIFLEPRQAQGGAKGIALDPASPRTPDLLVQHVLLQACRLLAGRARDGLTARGAAPLRLFLSHTKRDSIGLKIAEALKKYLDATTVERFFDEVSIQPGDDITPELEEGIKDSALVAIRTDDYVASPWCRLELALHKRERRPMVIIDALAKAEARATPFMANLASVRIDPGQITDEQLDRAANFTGLEVLRFLYVERQLVMLQEAGIVPTGAVLLPRPPEARDLIMAAQPGKGAEGGPVFIYPDPLLSKEETV